MFRVRNIRKIYWRGRLLLITFFLTREKYRELKPACQTNGKNSALYGQTTAVSGTIQISSGKSGTKLTWSSMKQIPLKVGKRVTDNSQAVMENWDFVAMSDRQKAYKIYLFSRLHSNGHISCGQWERETAYFASMPTFSLLRVKSYY